MSFDRIASLQACPGHGDGHGDSLVIYSPSNRSRFVYNPSPSLELTFSNGPKTADGFVLGWEDSCDIVLPKLPGVAKRHCAITFDEENHLVVNVLVFNIPSMVFYDGETVHELRRAYSHIVGGHWRADAASEITLRIGPIILKLDVNKADIGSDKFRENVRKLRASFQRGGSHMPIIIED